MKMDIAEGQIKLDDVILPGAVQSISVGGHAIIDPIKTIDGDTKKLTYGFKPKDLEIRIVLDNTDGSNASDDLAKLEDIFEYNPKGKKGTPHHYRINNFHTRARRLKEVIFSDLSSEERSADDLILATLSFEEFCPVCIKVRDVALEGNASGEADSGEKKKGPTSGINVDPPSPAQQGYDAGSGQ